ncbi:hypothetical protein MKX03_032224 [Papaver bracteatum]|nr:hypothetical protein MKX03_032221 [Papaver bracteatum]KAI3841745.1 hypothetical protein MKX03_032223 [Papaver bracteatum]KAI3841746.1 hypothetical protein MKX03_032224 [Papaver bracteatum]
MATGKFTAIACLVLFMVFCADFSSVIDASVACQQVYNIGSCNPLSWNDQQRCMAFCSSCRGGECTTRTGSQMCGCYPR